MLPYSRISTYALVAFFVLIAAYAWFEGQGVLFGPKISIATNVVETNEAFVRIEGEATHIEDLMMNGAPIPVTEQGAFSEPYLLAPGGNRIIFEAKDKYGHNTKKVVEIFYAPPASATSTAPAQEARTAATATPATSTKAVAR